MAKRKGFMMYIEWVDIIEELTGEDARRLLLDMRRYVDTGHRPNYEDNQMLRMAWKMIGARLDADGERYARTVAKSQEAANKRWDQQRQHSTAKPAADNVPPKMARYL